MSGSTRALPNEMSAAFPRTATFTGFNAPSRVEAEVFDLEVEGKLPAELEGTFYRCGPDPCFPPRFGDDININGDGMVMMFRFSGGHVDMRSRYVRTEKFVQEHAARLSLYGAYRNPFTDDPSVAGLDRTTANTNVVYHASRLFALKEDGRPHELDPDTLATRGRCDYGGRLASLTATAHPKIDPETGEMISHGYEARGLATRDISLQFVSARGELVREQMFLAPHVSMLHDWAVTSRHVVFPLMPTTTDVERLRRGGPHWMFDSRLETAIGVLRRDADVRDLRWFHAPARGLGHVVNAFSDGDRLYVDLFVSERNQFPFVANIDGRPFDRREATPRLTRWALDLSRPTGDLQARTLFPEFMEMPAIDPRYAMHPYRYGFCTVVDPERPLDVAGTIGVGWNTLVRVDVTTGRLDRYYVGERTTCQEPCFVPRSPSAPEGAGFILSQLTRFAACLSTEIVVLDAQHLAEGPIATIKVPFRLRAAVHGNWVPRSTLDGHRH